MTTIFTKPLNLIMLVAIAAVATIGFFVVPLNAPLPIHWGLNGEPDGFAPAPVALLLPLAFSLLVLVAVAIANRANPAEMAKGRHITEMTTTLLLGIFLLLEAIIVLIGLGQGVDVPRFVAGAVGVLFLGLGNMLPKSQPNSIAGVRLSWTLADANNWRLTNLWAGRMMMLAGLVLLAISALTNDSAILAVILIAAVSIPALASVAISYWISKKA